MPINYNDFDEWQSIQVRIPAAGGRLYTEYGGLVAYIGTDGQLQVMRGRDISEVRSWETFGITDPMEQQQMEVEIEKLITNLARKNNGNP